MAGVKRILEIAKAEIGTAESPPNSNRQKYGTAYGWNGVAWCVIFVWWCFRQAGADGLLPQKTASCSVLMNAAKRTGAWVTSGYQPGDVLIYNFGTSGKPQYHTGILETISGNVLTAIEGNTSTGNDSNGGRVMRRTRKTSVVVGAFRPAYDTETGQKHPALVAQECLSGIWKNGQTRRELLADAGYDYGAVQKLVNALLSGGFPATVTASSLNIRSAPTTESENVLYAVPRGTAVNVAEVREGPGASAWGRVSYERQTGRVVNGWISLDYVSF